MGRRGKGQQAGGSATCQQETAAALGQLPLSTLMSNEDRAHLLYVTLQ